MTNEEFINAVKKLGISIDDNQLFLLEEYYKYLIEYNNHTNLTAITKKEDIYLKHFYDSLCVCKAINLNTIQSIIDIGSGAGFPGIVLKIFYPHLHVTIIESNNKKTKFMKNLVNMLNLKNIDIINDRAENYAINNLNKYDLCVSRAVAFIDIITELSIPFIKKDGKVILMKGNFINEKITLDNHLKDLNIKKYNTISYKLPNNNDIRNLVVLEKTKLTTKVMNYTQIIKRNKKWVTSKSNGNTYSDCN